MERPAERETPKAWRKMCIVHSTYSVLFSWCVLFRAKQALALGSNRMLQHKFIPPSSIPLDKYARENVIPNTVVQLVLSRKIYPIKTARNAREPWMTLDESFALSLHSRQDWLGTWVNRVAARMKQTHKEICQHRERGWWAKMWTPACKIWRRNYSAMYVCVLKIIKKTLEQCNCLWRSLPLLWHFKCIKSNHKLTTRTLQAWNKKYLVRL